MEIEEQLKEGICQINLTIKKEDIDIQKGLMSSGVLDSFGFIEFISFVESKFNISIGEDELTIENFKNLASTILFLKVKLNE